MGLLWAFFVAWCFYQSNTIVHAAYPDSAIVLKPIVDAPFNDYVSDKIIYASIAGGYSESSESIRDLVYSFTQKVPGGQVKLFYCSWISTDILEFVKKFNGQVKLIRCSKLIQPYATTRFYCYYDELVLEKDSTKLGFVDTEDVVFYQDIFTKVVLNKVYLVNEPETFPIKKCPYHRQWIEGCKAFGPRVFKSIQQNSMICAGTIFGQVQSLLPFLSNFTETLRKTRCNDQGVLNVMHYYTKRFENVEIWKHEQRIVMSMNVAQDMNTDGAFVVHTGDNKKAIQTVKRPIFKDVLTFEENKRATALLFRIHELFGKNYVLDGGTLIGSQLYKARIPWDDDHDIYLLDSFVDQALKIIRNAGNLRMELAYNNLYYKIWYEDSGKKTPNKQKHGWPFVDVGILVGNKTHRWEKRVRESKYAHHVYRREWVFPARAVEFDGVILNQPANSRAILDHRFGLGWERRCVFANWDHKLEKVRYQYLGDGNQKVFKEFC